MLFRSFNELFPNKENIFSFDIKYSNRFSKFNSNIKIKGNYIEVNLSSAWKDIGDEVKMGLDRKSVV